MASLRIPDRFREGIIKVAEISEEAFEQLSDALEKAPECRDTNELSAWIANETPALNEADRNLILKSLAPMYRVQQNANVTLAVFASDLFNSLSEDAPNRMEAVSGATLKARIARLLEQRAWDLISTKISELKKELERSFCGARILTDMRPVFKNSVEEDPAAMMILHNLQIGYHDGMGKHQEFYVTLDASDLEDLQKALVRAKKKAATLTALIGKTGIKID